MDIAMDKFCCPNCFDHHGLGTYIFPMLSTVNGTCSYCNSQSEKLANPESLGEYFELLISSYELGVKGDKTICEYLRDDWLIFNKNCLDLNGMKSLLSDILDDGEIVRKPFKPIDIPSVEPVADWPTLKDELRYKNRYFLDEKLKEDRLSELLDHLILDDLPENWYRVRIMSDTEAFPLSKMGAPPKELSSHGRANPPGIPYLYLASTPETGIAEVRPHTGETACVAKFKIVKPIKVADLRNPRKLVSPFLLQGMTDVIQLRKDLPFLETLGEELTRPVLPRSAAIDYVPSQFLCEFIKKKGFSGVLYSSSVGSGMNMALFDLEAAEAISVATYSIDRVLVDSSHRA